MDPTCLNHHNLPVETKLTLFSRLAPVDSVLSDRSCVESLPSEISLNIFSRLPVESVSNCRLVCKLWANLLDLGNMNPHFVNMHLRHDSGVKSFIVFIKNKVGIESRDAYEFRNKKPYCGLFHVDDTKDPNCLTITRINLRLEYSVSGIVGSCNGLICLSHESKRWNYYRKEGKPICICNPVTGEYITLPGNCISSSSSNHWLHCSVLGFGYHPVTDEYKVIRISYLDNLGHPHAAQGRVEVYTLGSGSGWRNTGETKYYNLLNYSDQASICVNGSLYWISKISGLAVAFDLVDEEFRSVETQINGEFRFLGVTKSGEVLFQHRESGSLCGYDPKAEAMTPIKLCDWNYVITDEEMIWHVNSFVSLAAIGEGNVRTYPPLLR